jgi:hypothetical protein
MGHVQLPDEVDVVEYMFDQGWTDGLPVVPPTPERVERMLTAAAVEYDHVVGSVPLRDRTITAGVVAVNAVLAGCRPEYFPVVLTAVEAMLDPAFNLDAVVMSTAGSAIAVVVSGPLAAELGMNSGHNILGGGARANATIGRAVRLLVLNALGAKGPLEASSFGHPGKISFCFAAKPAYGLWEGLNVEAGYLETDTVVTVMAVEAPRLVANHLNGDPEGVLRSIASAMRPPAGYAVGKVAEGRASQVIVVIGPEHESIVREAGWSKADVKDFLVRESRIAPSEIAAAGVVVEAPEIPAMDGTLPVVTIPEDLVLITGGGAGAGWSVVIPAFTSVKHSRSVVRRVRPTGEALPDCGPESCEVPAGTFASVSKG